MSDADRQQTVALKVCSSCGAELRRADRFCRRCGVSQAGQAMARRDADPNSSAGGSMAEPAPAKGEFYHPLTRPLMTGLVQGLAASLEAPSCPQTARRFLPVLLWIPLWLLILLLSPLDAYAAARALLKSSK